MASNKIDQPITCAVISPAVGGRSCIAQAKPALREQNRRKGARNQQRVIEPGMKKFDVAMWLDDPTVDRVKHAAQHAQRVKDISKPPHNNARIIMPKPNANSTLRRMIFDKIMRESISFTQPMSNAIHQANCDSDPCITRGVGCNLPDSASPCEGLSGIRLAKNKMRVSGNRSRYP